MKFRIVVLMLVGALAGCGAENPASSGGGTSAAGGSRNNIDTPANIDLILADASCDPITREEAEGMLTLFEEFRRAGATRSEVFGFAVTGGEISVARDFNCLDTMLDIVY